MRQRATNRAIADARGARALIQPFTVNIGSWQQRIARLNATMNVSYSRTSDILLALSEARVLRTEIGQTLKQLDEAIWLAPETVAAHSRVADVRGSLDGMLTRLQDVLSRSTDQPALHFETNLLAHRSAAEHAAGDDAGLKP